ncbi:MAG: hypothetical protein RIQ90_1242 [Bacteroidota bacterium]|jgi:penicillin-binding protein 1A
MGITEKDKRKYTIILWFTTLIPFLALLGLFLSQTEDELPPVSMLDNPPEMQASLVFSSTGDTLGRFWSVNRTSVTYKDVSPYVFDALIATEDERFLEHAGIDFRATLRAFTSLGKSGGGSTITQQLAKNLFTIQQRKLQKEKQLPGIQEITKENGWLWKNVNRSDEKSREIIIATRLEKRFTKQEILIMYLNTIEFNNNAVGIESASQVYFGKKPIALTKEEAAVLVGMCKSPSLYNPYDYKKKNYVKILAKNKKIKESEVSRGDVAAARSKDSVRAITRRNQVLYQWLKNSEANNPALRYKLSRSEYERLIEKPIVTKFKVFDHKENIAPYFVEALRTEANDILHQKNTDGSYKIVREDGEPYDIYSDGLKIYTTLDIRLQKYAEQAVEKHLSQTLQPAFNRNNQQLKNYPFTNSTSTETVNYIMNMARKNSKRYQVLSEVGLSHNEIIKTFDVPANMRVFSWSGEKDTVMTPNDSIRYYKAFLHAGLVSIEPQTGFVRAWVGGANFKHFSYDHVRQGARQVGSTIKPFVYAAALAMHVVTPCTVFGAGDYGVKIENKEHKVVGRWRPKGGASGSFKMGLANSSNPTTAAVMGRMGAYNPHDKTGGPFQVNNLLKSTEIILPMDRVVPSICLGSIELPIIKMTAAQCIFANNGVYTRPTTIERIEDRNGKVIYAAFPVQNQALNSTVAYEILKIMKLVVTRGTGKGLIGGKYGKIPPTAGKTGTTQKNADGWFIGVRPDLVTGVWVGAEDPSVRFLSTGEGQGSRVALPIYGYYMQKAYKDPVLALSIEDFEEPSDYDEESYSCDDGPPPPDGKSGEDGGRRRNGGRSDEEENDVGIQAEEFWEEGGL